MSCCGFLPAENFREARGSSILAMLMAPQACNVDVPVTAAASRGLVKSWKYSSEK